MNQLESNEFYKQTIQILESDVTKLRFENIKLEKELKKLQENLSLRSQNQNNTSSAFSLPSEFKSNWDLLIKDLIASVFMDFVETPLIYVNLVQELLLIIDIFVENQIKNMTNEVILLLKLEENTKENIHKRLLPIYQDYNSFIFKINDDQIKQIKSIFNEKLIKIIIFDYKSNEKNCFEQVNNSNNQNEIPENYKEKIESLIESADLSKLIITYQNLSVYMQLSEPPLNLSLISFEKREFRYIFYKKTDYICIDGFAKENSIAIIVLPSVMRGNFAYNGIKPAVLMIAKELEKPEMRKIAEKEEEKEKKRKEKSKTEASDRIEEKGKNIERKEFLEDEKIKEDKTKIIGTLTDRSIIYKNDEKKAETPDRVLENEENHSKTFEDGLLKNSLKKKAWSPLDFKQKLKDNFSLFLNNKNLLKEVLQNKKNFLNESGNNNKSSQNKQSFIAGIEKLESNSPSSSSFSFENNIISKDSPFFNSKKITLKTKQNSCDLKPPFLNTQKSIKDRTFNNDLPLNSESFIKRKLNFQQKETNQLKIPYFSQKDKFTLKNDHNKTDVNLPKTILSLKKSIDLLKNSKNKPNHSKSKEKFIAQETEKAGRIINQSKKLKNFSEFEKSNIFEEKERKSFIDEPRPLNKLAEKLKKEIMAINEKREKNSYQIPNNRNKNIDENSVNSKNKLDFKRSLSVKRAVNCLIDTLSSDEEKQLKNAQKKKIGKNL